MVILLSPDGTSRRPYAAMRVLKVEAAFKRTVERPYG
jgi:hypothetical protein